MCSGTRSNANGLQCNLKKVSILAATQYVYQKKLCGKDVHERHLFDHFEVRHDWYLTELVQHAFNCCKVQRQSACVSTSALLLRRGDVAVTSFSALRGSLFYLGFRREEKGCANQETVVVVNIISQEGRGK